MAEDSKPQLKAAREVQKIVSRQVPKPRALVPQSKVNDMRNLQLFLEEYFANGGNGTQAVITVFGEKSRAGASTRASNYLKQAGNYQRMLLESKGVGLSKLFDVAIEKLEKSKTPEWFDRLMKISGHADFMSKGNNQGAGTVNIITAQTKVSGEFGFEDEAVIEGEEVDETPKE